MSINRSFVSQLNFSILINRLENTTFDIQEVSLPGLTLGSVAVSTPFTKIPFAGDHLEFGDFNIKFKVDEKFQNWYEIFKWMTGLGFPKDFKQYSDTKSGLEKTLAGLPLLKPEQKDLSRKIGNIYSPITLTVLTSHKNPLIEFEFIDAFPTSMSPVDFKTTDNSVDYLTAMVSFKYVSYSARIP
jgi:hypothetical protein